MHLSSVPPASEGDEDWCRDCEPEPPAFARERMEGKRLERSWRANRDAINFINMVIDGKGPGVQS